MRVVGKLAVSVVKLTFERAREAPVDETDRPGQGNTQLARLAGRRTRWKVVSTNKGAWQGRFCWVLGASVQVGNLKVLTLPRHVAATAQGMRC